LVTVLETLWAKYTHLFLDVCLHIQIKSCRNLNIWKQNLQHFIVIVQVRPHSTVIIIVG
jgi:hypothetical protein